MLPLNWFRIAYVVAVLSTFAGFWLLSAGQYGNASIPLLVIAFPSWALLTLNRRLSRNPNPNYRNPKEAS